MFYNPESIHIWEKLKRAAKKDDKSEFVALFQERFTMLEEHQDELRMLFYVGVQCDRQAYLEALALFNGWKERHPDDFQWRTDTFLYSVEQYLREQSMQGREYLIEGFKKTMGLA